MKIRMSIMAASIAAMGMFSGCSDSSLGSQTFGVNLTAVDGYIERLNAPAIATCESAFFGDTKMFYSAANTATPNGKVTFAIDESYTDCLFSIPADAMLANNTPLGFAMARRANVSERVEDVLTTPLTTYVEAKRTAGTPVDDDFLELINEFNPITNLDSLGSADAATDAEATQMAAFSNTIVNVLKVKDSSTALAQVSSVEVENAIDNESTDVNITAMLDTVTDFNTTSVENLATEEANMLDVIALLPAGTDRATVYVEAIDGNESLNVALDTATADGDFDYAAVPDLNESTVLTIANDAAAAEEAVAALPAYLKLGSTLKLGTKSITLNADGTFTTTIDVSSASTLADFSTVTLPSATVNKAFSNQSIFLKTVITSNNNADNNITAKLGTNNFPMALSNDTNTTVKITIPDNTFVEVTDTYASTYSSTNTVGEMMNDDLTFDACAAIGGCAGDAFDSLNAHLKVEGKSYNVSITIMGLDSNITTDYTTITGTVTTN